jgi:hypothetical protein
MNESKGLAKEAARIHWRLWVMNQPGGIDYLMSLIGLKEKDIGPSGSDKWRMTSR